MSQPHHALLFIMTALPWQCLLQTSLLAMVAAGRRRMDFLVNVYPPVRWRPQAA